MWLAAQHELLLSIIERPHDDQLRLVLADKLAESSNPLGELISVQCSLERIRGGKATGDYKALKARERQLIDRHGAEWHQQAAPFARRLVMRRGLPHTLYTAADALLEDGGLTVVAPIEQLELEHVDAVQLQRLFRLPLFHRIEALGMTDLRGLSRLERAPGPMPPNIVELRLGIDGARALDASITLGLLDHVQKLEFGTRWLVPGSIELLAPPAAPALKKLTLTGLPLRLGRSTDEAWLPSLRQLVEGRPGLIIGWRGIDYDASNLDRIVITLEPLGPQDESAPLPAGDFNREPFGEVPDSVTFDRAMPSTVDFQRLPDGALLATSKLNGGLSEIHQPISLDATTHLLLEPHPAVLTARAFELSWNTMRVRYEPWPCLSLFQLGLPLPAPLALRIVEGIARGMPPLRAGLARQGLLAWPSVLSFDEVLVGVDGAVKLMPPFRNCMMVDERSDADSKALRPLGLRCEPDFEGTEEGMLLVLGTGLMHLLAGLQVERRVRPSSLDVEWKPLDALVEGCLTHARADLFPSVEVFLERLNALPDIASQDAVAQAVRTKQSTPA